MRCFAFAFALSLIFFAQAPAIIPPAAAGDRVDVQLVLALDASTSMSARERAVERGGFAAAFRDPIVARAITSGPRGRIAVICYLWGGPEQQRLLVPWTLIDGPAAAARFAAALEAGEPRALRRGTAFGDALRHAAALFGSSPFEGGRRVVNIASDGVQNAGPDLGPYRAALLEAGVTINGMPILTHLGPPDPRQRGIGWNAAVTRYFTTEVAGGPASFVEVVSDPRDMVPAARRKLLREINEPALVADLGP